MFKQVDFLIQGYLLPMTIGRLQISPSFVIEDVIAKKDSRGFFALAYIGVEAEPNFFKKALSKMDLFLLLHALMTGQAATHLLGAAVSVSTLDDLGKKRVTFPGYEKVIHLNEDMKSELSEPILLTKERFLQLEKDTDRILDGHIGLALRYYYRAAQASGKRRVAEVVIDLAIAAEALFSREPPYTANLRRRFSNFIADDELERRKISKRIGKFYSLRGAIVHGAKKKAPGEEIRTASKYIRKAIDKALSSQFYTKAELIRRADEPASSSLSPDV